jgi:biotin transport system substrate-specific component
VTAASLPSRRPGVLADTFASTGVHHAVLVGGYALAIAAAAQVAIPLPFGPVPLTLQTLAVLLGAAALGTTRAAAGAGLYLGLGVIGVPWFAVSGGATLGYVVGFAIAAATVGAWARSGGDRSVRGAAALMVVGNLIIYVFGVTGLVLVAGLSAGAAIVTGVVPFLLGDAIKIAVAAAMLPAAWRSVDTLDRG